MRVGIVALVLACGVGFGLGCEEPKPEPPASEILARVNDEVITLEDFKRALAAVPRPLRGRLDDSENRAAFLERLVNERLIISDARQRGLDQDPNHLAKMRLYEQRLLSRVVRQQAQAAKLSDPDAPRAYYDAHRDDEYTVDRVHVRQILVKDEEAARQLRAELEQGADFEALARAHSSHRSARRGGDLGYTVRGTMGPKFDGAAFALSEPGQLSDVVESVQGFHIIQLVEPPEEFVQPFESVQGAVRRDLRREIIRTYVEQLRSTAQIETNLELLAAAIEAERDEPEEPAASSEALSGAPAETPETPDPASSDEPGGAAQ